MSRLPMITCVLLPSLPRLCSGRSPRGNHWAGLLRVQNSTLKTPGPPGWYPKNPQLLSSFHMWQNCSSEKVGWHPTPRHHDLPVIETGRSP